MTPSYAVKKGRRYRYYVSRPLITQDRRESSTALRIPAAEIEPLVTSRVRQWLLDPGGIYQSTRLPDPSAQRRLIARAVEIGKSWTELPGGWCARTAPCPTGRAPGIVGPAHWLGRVVRARNSQAPCLQECQTAKLNPSRLKAIFQGHEASLTVRARGGFTVGAWLPERGVELECDLADPAIAPSRVNLRSPARPAFVS